MAVVMSTAPSASSDGLAAALGRTRANAGAGSAPLERARRENVSAAQRALAGVAQGALEVHRQLAAVVEVAEADGVPELVRADAPVVVRAVGALVGPLHVGAEACVGLDVVLPDPPHPRAG